MAKLPYNAFIRQYPKAPRFMVQVLSKGPGTYTQKGLKLPTPYGLLEEWCRAHLTGDWTLDGGKIVEGKRICSVLVASMADAKLLQSTFGLTKITSGRYAGRTQLTYRDQNYKAVAKSLGYDIR